MVAKHIAFPRTLSRIKEDLLTEPVVIALDPGVTTGWSVIKVHPEALVSPKISILSNVLHWSHGQIVGETVDDSVGNADPFLHQKREEVARNAGNGWTIDTSPESHAAHEVLELVKVWPGCAVVLEDFIVRQFNAGRDFLAPVRISAAVDYALWKIGIQPFRQQPSEAKGAVTDVRLKSWGFYESKGGLNHARDADRHSLTFLRKMKDPSKGGYRRHLAWPHIYDRSGELL